MPTTGESPATNWRPFPLCTPFLSAFIILCVFLILLVELTIRSCLPPEGCPIIGVPSPEISNTAAFVYNYLPTAITITVGLIWAVANHDYMRMEPWFQLSKTEGATAAESIWLKYSYTFPPFVAIKAGRARHYTVMVSSLLFLFISMFLTPVTSGILEEASLVKHAGLETNYTYLPWLEPEMADHYDKKLPLTYVYMAYSYSWLNGSLPPFTTAEYAVAPWTNEGNKTSHGQNGSWTGQTFIYEADLVCEEVLRIPQIKNANSSDYYDGRPPHNFTNVNGTLNYGEDNALLATNYDMGWIWEYSFQAARQPNSNRTSWIFTWAKADDPFGNYSSTICSPKIYMEPVNATVRMPSGEVESVSRLPEPERAAVRVDIQESPWLDLLFTNLTMNEYFQDIEEPDKRYGALLQLFPRGAYQMDRRFGYKRNAMSIYDSDLWAGTVNFDNTGFLALTLSDQHNSTLPDLLQWENLAERSRKSFKLILSCMCADTRVSSFAKQFPTPVLSRFVARGYQVNVSWGRAAQGGLLFIIISVLVLLILGWGRKCCLDGEPNTLAVSLALLERSPKIVEQFRNGEYHSPGSLKKELLGNGSIYHLRHAEGEGPWIDIDGNGLQQLPSPVEERQYRLPEGWPTSGASGISFEFVFLLMSALLIFVYMYDRNHNGIPSIFPLNSLNYKILFSYLPAVLGLVMEPFLVTLGSYHCMFGSYEKLRRGGSKSRWTLSLDLDKSPPHFQIIRSLRSRNFTLAGLALAILLSNVFGSALSGIFSSKIAYITHNLRARPYGTPIIHQGLLPPDMEMWTRITTELNGGLSVPSWTTPEYYVLPVSLDFPAAPTNISVPTLGLGATVSCSLIPDLTVSRYCKEYILDNVTAEVSWKYSGPPPCTAEGTVRKGFWKYESEDPCWPREDRPDWVANGILMSSTCPDTSFAFWGQEEKTENVVIRCEITERVVGMIATVDSEGMVLAVEELNQFTQSEIVALYDEESRNNESLRMLPMTLNTSGFAKGTSMPIINYVMRTLYPSISNDTVTGLFEIPGKTDIAEAFEHAFKKIYARNIHVQQSDLLSAVPGPSKDIPATVIDTGNVVTVSTIMFGLALAILLYTILLVPVIYRRHSATMIPHLPVNLAQTWTALYRSEAKSDCGMVRGKNPGERAKRLGELGHTYTYGAYIDVDGKASYGVFRKRTEDSD